MPGDRPQLLTGNLHPEIARPAAELIEYARMLDKYSTPTCFPNGFESGAPTDFYPKSEAENAFKQAEAILEFCHRRISRS